MQKVVLYLPTAVAILWENEEGKKIGNVLDEFRAIRISLQIKVKRTRDASVSRVASSPV